MFSVYLGSIQGLNCWNNKRVTATLYDLGMADHSRAQEAMEITLEDLDNQEFDTNEIMITVIGKRATQCSWDDIQVTLNRTTGPAGAEEDSFYQVYRLEDPTRWFLITNKPEADLLNNTAKTDNNLPFSLHFKKKRRRKLNYKNIIGSTQTKITSHKL